jgi:hypothetical protein
VVCDYPLVVLMVYEEDVVLKLTSPSGGDNSRDRGSIVIRFIGPDVEDITPKSIASAQGTLAISRAAGLADPPGAISGNTSIKTTYQPRCRDSLGGIVLKLSMLTGIIDDSAKVRAPTF